MVLPRMGLSKVREYLQEAGVPSAPLLRAYKAWRAADEACRVAHAALSEAADAEDPQRPCTILAKMILSPAQHDALNSGVLPVLADRTNA